MEAAWRQQQAQASCLQPSSRDGTLPPPMLPRPYPTLPRPPPPPPRMQEVTHYLYLEMQQQRWWSKYTAQPMPPLPPLGPVGFTLLLCLKESMAAPCFQPRHYYKHSPTGALGGVGRLEGCAAGGGGRGSHRGSSHAQLPATCEQSEHCPAPCVPAHRPPSSPAPPLAPPAPPPPTPHTQAASSTWSPAPPGARRGPPSA